MCIDKLSVHAHSVKKDGRKIIKMIPLSTMFSANADMTQKLKTTLLPLATRKK